MTVFVIYTGMVFWAKRLKRFSRVQFWDVARMKHRYESSVLNVGALFFSLVVVPAGAMLALIGIADGPNSSDPAARYFIAGIMLTILRELYIVVCDMFAKRTPAMT